MAGKIRRELKASYLSNLEGHKHLMNRAIHSVFFVENCILWYSLCWWLCNFVPVVARFWKTWCDFAVLWWVQCCNGRSRRRLELFLAAAGCLQMVLHLWLKYSSLSLCLSRCKMWRVHHMTGLPAESHVLPCAWLQGRTRILILLFRYRQYCFMMFYECWKLRPSWYRFHFGASPFVSFRAVAMMWRNLEPTLQACKKLCCLLFPNFDFDLPLVWHQKPFAKGSFERRAGIKECPRNICHQKLPKQLASTGQLKILKLSSNTHLRLS